VREFIGVLDLALNFAHASSATRQARVPGAPGSAAPGSAARGSAYPGPAAPGSAAPGGQPGQSQRRFPSP
jgi:hypothetical protein